jgi:ankyrin repeat protein
VGGQPETPIVASIVYDDGVISYAMIPRCHPNSSNFFFPSVVYGKESCIVDAVRAGDVLRVQRILSDNVSANIVSDEGATPLMYAALQGRLDLVQLLVGYGADVNAQDRQSKWTALMQAVFHGKVDVAKYLLSVGADVTLQAENSCTAVDLVYLVDQSEVHDDLEFIQLLARVYQKQTDVKVRY